MRIGFIGTGVMGCAMASRLLQAGHQLWVYTRTAEKANELVEQGAKWCNEIHEICSEVDVLCTMVSLPTDVEEVYFGESGIFQCLEKPKLLIDFTTSCPELAKHIAEAATQFSMAALDAPVSGGDIGAKNGSLSIMVGGEAAAFEEAQEIFDCLGKIIRLQGPAGSGQHTKMVNQILIAPMMIGVCEGILYAERAGLDPRNVIGSVGQGAAGSWSINELGPRILDRNFEPGFYVEHFLKDMDIALEQAKAMNLAMPGLALARQLYEAVRAQGLSKKGTQALYLALERLNTP